MKTDLLTNRPGNEMCVTKRAMLFGLDDIRRMSMIKNPFGNRYQRINRSMAAPVSAVVLSMIFFPLFANAQLLDKCEAVAGEGYKCEYEYMDNQIQKVPGFFKFQSRISQAKLPVGDVVFNTIYVNLKSGTETLCTEEFSNVPVRDSVLNLEIGHTMDCALDMKIAESNDIQLQVCLGSTENCLKPVEFSSVPFAIKSSYAREAQIANEANEAVQCHFAHLITADKDLFSNPSIGTGYYDFATPTPEKVANLINLWDTAMSVPFNSDEMNALTKGGYIQWNQVDPAYGSNLHICSQIADSAENDLGRLTSLIFHAEVTNSLGQMVVWGYPEYKADDDKGDDPGYVRGLVSKNGTSLFGHTYMDHNVTMGLSSTVMPRLPDPDRHTANIYHNTNVQGDATFTNDVYIGTDPGGGGPQCVVNHESFFYNDVTMGTAAGAIDMKKVRIDDELNIKGTTHTYNNVHMTSPSESVDDRTLEVDNIVKINGTTNIYNDTYIGTRDGTVDTKTATIDDQLYVNGTARFNNDIYMGIPNAIDINNVFISDALDVSGTTTFSNNVTINVPSGGGVTLFDVNNYGTQIDSTFMWVNALSYFENGVAFNGVGVSFSSDTTVYLAEAPVIWTEKFTAADMGAWGGNYVDAVTYWGAHWELDPPARVVWGLPKDSWSSSDGIQVSIILMLMIEASGGDFEINTELNWYFQGYNGGTFLTKGTGERTTVFSNPSYTYQYYEVTHTIYPDAIPSDPHERGYQRFDFDWLGGSQGGQSITKAWIFAAEVTSVR
jgi:hypothetical protein